MMRKMVPIKLAKIPPHSLYFSIHSATVKTSPCPIAKYGTYHPKIKVDENTKWKTRILCQIGTYIQLISRYGKKVAPAHYIPV